MQLSPSSLKEIAHVVTACKAAGYKLKVPRLEREPLEPGAALREGLKSLGGCGEVDTTVRHEPVNAVRLRSIVRVFRAGMLA